MILSWKYFAKLAENPQLRDYVTSKVNTMSSAQLAALVANDGEDLCLKRAVDIFSNVRDWREANAVANDLILPLIPKLTQDHVARIIRSPRTNRADLAGSRGFLRFLIAAGRESEISMDDIYKWLEEEGMEDELEELRDAAEREKESL